MALDRSKYSPGRLRLEPEDHSAVDDYWRGSDAAVELAHSVAQVDDAAPEGPAWAEVSFEDVLDVDGADAPACSPVDVAEDDDLEIALEDRRPTRQGPVGRAGRGEGWPFPGSRVCRPPLGSRSRWRPRRPPSGPPARRRAPRYATSDRGDSRALSPLLVALVGASVAALALVLVMALALGRWQTGASERPTIAPAGPDRARAGGRAPARRSGQTRRRSARRARRRRGGDERSARLPRTGVSEPEPAGQPAPSAPPAPAASGSSPAGAPAPPAGGRSCCASQGSGRGAGAGGGAGTGGGRGGGASEFGFEQ